VRTAVRVHPHRRDLAGCGAVRPDDGFDVFRDVCRRREAVCALRRHRARSGLIQRMGNQQEKHRQRTVRRTMCRAPEVQVVVAAGSESVARVRKADYGADERQRGGLRVRGGDLERAAVAGSARGDLESCGRIGHNPVLAEAVEGGGDVAQAVPRAIAHGEHARDRGRRCTGAGGYTCVSGPSSASRSRDAPGCTRVGVRRVGTEMPSAATVASVTGVSASAARGGFNESARLSPATRAAAVTTRGTEMRRERRRMASTWTTESGRAERPRCS
jgi:hypothetical protein